MDIPTNNPSRVLLFFLENRVSIMKKTTTVAIKNMTVDSCDGYINRPIKMKVKNSTSW